MVYSVPWDVEPTTLGDYPSIEIAMEDLPEILSEFEQVREYVWKDRSLSKAVRESIKKRVDDIIEDLEENWEECPGADRLWMG